jgi:hypothetical protein
MTPTTKSPRWIALVLAGAMGAFGGVARAGEGEEDAAALLRHARTAEAVDRDVPGAIALYRKAIDAAVTGDAAREAWLGLARLYERTGKSSEALKAWDQITERFSEKLTDAEKKEAHEAIGRLLPPGAHGRSPLGDVFVRPAGDATGAASDAPSPMDAKIVALLAKYESAEPQNRGSVRAELINILRPVGADAVPALTRALRTENPVRARLAAELVAMFGGVRAVAALEKTIVEGDPFARGAAIEGLAQVAKTPETSAALTATIDRLLDMPALADRRARLRDIEAGHLTDAQLVARYDAGGEAAGTWLTAAVARNSPLALAKVLDVAKAGGAVPEAMLDSLATAAGGQGNLYTSWEAGRLVSRNAPRSTALDAAARLTILKVLLAQEPTARRLSQAAEVASVTATVGPEEAARQGAEAVWTRVLGVADPEVRLATARELLRLAVGIPPAVLTEEEARHEPPGFAATAPALLRGTWNFNGWTLLHPAAEAGNAFWVPLLEAADGLAPGEDGNFRNALQQVRDATERLARVGQVLDAVEAGAPATPAVRTFLTESTGTSSLTWTARGAVAVPDIAMPAGLRARVVKVFLRQPGPEAARQTALVTAALLGTAGADRDAARRLVWTAATSPGEPARRDLATELLRVGVEPPPETYADPRGRDAIARAWARLAVTEVAPLGAAVQDALTRPEVWDVLFAAWAVDGPDAGRALMRAMTNVAVPHDARGFADPRWLDVLKTYVGGPANSVPYLPLYGAARTNDPRFLELLRAGDFLHLAEDAMAGTAAAALFEYAGPGRLEALREAVLDPAVRDHAKQGLAQALAGRPIGSPEHAILLDYAARAAPTSGFAVLELAQIGDREGLAKVLEGQTGAAARTRDSFRLSLIAAARRLHLKEAVPFLLEQFRGGYEKEASEALDDIRSYYERAALYEDLAQGSTERRKDLAKLLEDKDPEIRRAAVLSLGAMGDKEALPRLVRIAKEDQDPRVRAAALEAVERISRATPPAPKPGG